MNDPLENHPSSIIQTRASDQKHCFSCGTLLHTSAVQCPKCGAQQPAVSMSVEHKILQPVVNTPAISPIANQAYCRGCGTEIHATAISCPKCGATQKVSITTTPYAVGKDRVAAVLFAFLLGGFGAHKFYLGQIWRGLLYFIFCWTFIPSIIAFIEGIYFLTMSDSEFSRKFV